MQKWEKFDKSKQPYIYFIFAILTLIWSFKNEEMLVIKLQLPDFEGCWSHVEAITSVWSNKSQCLNSSFINIFNLAWTNNQSVSVLNDQITQRGKKLALKKCSGWKESHMHHWMSIKNKKCQKKTVSQLCCIIFLQLRSWLT